jgi:hypothetical protein
MSHVQKQILASGKSLPVSSIVGWIGLPRSNAYYQPRRRRAKPVDESLAARIKQIHEKEPSCGVRGTWSRLRFGDGIGNEKETGSDSSSAEAHNLGNLLRYISVFPHPIDDLTIHTET